MTEKKELTNLTKEELVAEIAGLGEKVSGQNNCGNGYIFAV